MDLSNREDVYRVAKKVEEEIGRVRIDFNKQNIHSLSKKASGQPVTGFQCIFY